MGQLFANNVAGKLAAPIDEMDTTLVLEAGQGEKFPVIHPESDDYFTVTLVDVVNGEEVAWEVLWVYERVGDTFTVEERYVEDGARAWAAGTVVEMRLDAYTLYEFESKIGPYQPELYSPKFNGEVFLGGTCAERSYVVSSSYIYTSQSNFFTKDVSSNVSFSIFSPGFSDSYAYSFTLLIRYSGGTITWPSSIQWPGGVAPNLNTGKSYLFTFVTNDDGTTWRGSVNVDYNV